MISTLLRHATLAVLLLGVAACNSNKTITGEVNFLNATEPGTLYVSAGGYGLTRPEAIANAERNAFNCLIFRGVPGSQYRLPLVSDERAARKAHGRYFEQLLEGDGYRSFLMSSEIRSDFQARLHRNNLTAAVKINVDALRRDMENQNVIRKLGY